MVDDSDKILDENHKHNMDVFSGKKSEVKKVGRPKNGAIPEFVDNPDKPKRAGRPKGTGKNNRTEIDPSRVWALHGKPYGFNQMIKELNGDITKSPALKFALNNLYKLCIDPETTTALGANKVLLQHLNELGDAKEAAFSMSQMFVRPDGKLDEPMIKKEGERLKNELYDGEN